MFALFCVCLVAALLHVVLVMDTGLLYCVCMYCLLAGFCLLLCLCCLIVCWFVTGLLVLLVGVDLVAFYFGVV